MKNIKQHIKIILPTLIVGLFLGWLFFHSSGSTSSAEKNTEAHDHSDETVYTCSMHPQIKQDKPGLCPICAMDLVPMSSLDDTESTNPNEIHMTKAAMELAAVQTVRVSSGIPEKELHLLGKVKPDERRIAQLTARFGGRIEELFVNYTGQKVNRGQKLATIYSPELITAQKELLEAVKYKNTNPSFYKAARSKLKLWDLTEQQIDNIVQNSEPKLYFDIVSPISGTVTQRHVAKGDYVKEGVALFEVIDLSHVWVMFEAYESDLPWIKPGDEVTFTLQSVPGELFTGKVAYIAPLIDAKTRTTNVRVEVTNKNGKLKPEMFANGVIRSTIESETNELLIPKSAVLWTGKRSVVYVKIPNREKPTFLYREVVLGPEAGNFYVVEEGLTEGEEIAVNGVFKIDAAAQLAGKTSMMTPPSANASGGSVSTGHDHGNMEHDPHEMKDGNLSHTSFKVAGNCSMCKDRIESTALELDGVNSASWSSEDQVLHLNFNKDKVALNEVHKAIANAGHDTEKVSAPDKVYDNLPGCCKYSRHQPESNEYIETSFQVSGNCSMCKNRIEKTAKTVKGVRQAVWNAEEQKLTVEVNADIDMDEIHEAIANAGHDTEKVKAPDEVYEELPGCCKYTREK